MACTRLATTLRLDGKARALALMALIGMAACDSSGVLVPAPQLLTQRVEPDSVMLELGQTRQFRAVGDFSDGVTRDLPASFTATGGVVTGAGFYTATTAGSFTVVASFQGGGAAAAKVIVNQAPASLQRVILTPDTGRVQTLQNIQFTATGVYADGITRPVSVTFSATGGSISSSGLYSAGSAAGTFRVVAQAATGQADTSTVLITSTAPPPPTLSSIVLAPQLITLQTGAQQQFTVTAQFSDGTTGNVTSQATFTAPGGTMTAGGLYTAGNTPGTYQVAATVQGHQSFATVNITPALQSISIQPGSASLQPGGTQKFTVVGQFSTGTADITSNATLTATGGTITASGDYTAGSTPGSYQVNATAFGFNASATVTIASPTTPTVTAISLSPASATVQSGQTQQFTATATYSDGSTAAVTVAYSQTGGSITPAGLYTAGTNPGTYRVIGTHSSGRADTAAITIPAPTLTSISISPAVVTLGVGGLQQFTSTAHYSNGTTGAATVSYAQTGGAITAAGLYTAGTTAGSYRVIATHASGLADTANVTISTTPTADLVNISAWSPTLIQSHFGGASTVTLVNDPDLGVPVARVLFPQSSGVSYTQGAVSLPTPTVSAWVSMMVKWEPGFTTVGPYPSGHDDSYKLFFVLWQNYNARAGMGLSNGTRWNADWGISDRQTGTFYHPTETILPGSDPIGAITTEWQDDEWYQYVFGQIQIAADMVEVHHAWRRYTLNGQVNPGPWTHSIMTERGNMPAGLPVINRVSLGGNKNKNNPTDMYIRWGPVRIAQGSNPFNVN